jgi:hypothetical protein
VKTVTKAVLFALGTLALVGCSSFKPVGPLAKQVPITQQGQPLPNAPQDAAAKAPALRPTPPTMYVTPGEVNANNAHAAAARLAEELSADNKATVNAPVTAEVSRIKGGR